jgi:hypothetical protein
MVTSTRCQSMSAGATYLMFQKSTSIYYLRDVRIPQSFYEVSNFATLVPNFKNGDADVARTHAFVFHCTYH